MRALLIKLLAIDMDGTCLNNKHVISTKNLEAIKKAARQGINIVPTTGRTATCLPAQLKYESVYRYIISSNGADVSDVRENKSIYQAHIPSESVIPFLAKCENERLGITVHLNHEFLVQGRLLYLLGRLSYGQDAAYAKYCKDIMEDLKYTDIEEIQLFYFSHRKKEKAMDLISKQENIVAAYDRFYAEIYSPEASKGNALQALMKHLSLSPDEVACIGDGQNDLSMGRVAGVTFAMGNAVDEMKKIADKVLPDCDHSGVAYAIEHYILGEKNL